MVHIWKGEYQSEQANDLKWELWLSEPSSWEMVRLVFGGLGSGQWVAAVGSWIYTTAASGLQRSELSDAHPILQALIWWPHKRVWLAVAEDGLWISDDLTNWQRLETNLPVADIVALEVVQNDISSLAALTVDGKIWLWRS
jgi:hypothetical protein